MKILILASNPRKDLSLDHEIRDLTNVIANSHHHREFEVEDALAVRVGDLQDLLFRHRPQIVHFCGHGSGQQGLVFESDNGGEHWVRAEALSELFRLFASNISCVLLNACYSEEQANAIVEHINYVIGMNQEIRDDAAIAFSKGFYRALGYECSIEEAFEFGKNAIQLEISGSTKQRSTTTEETRKAEVVTAIQQTAIPEHLKPVIKIRENTTTPTESVSQATREAIQFDIEQSLQPAPVQSPTVEQYRERIREFLRDRKLSALETIRLEQLGQDLGLSQAEAHQILIEEQTPILKAQEDYKTILTKLIEAGHYPFDAETKAELETMCKELQLTDKEVIAIETPILANAEANYQAKLQQQQQDHQQNLQQYEQAFKRVLSTEYPIKNGTRNQLNSFQQVLSLSSEDVDRIEQPLLAVKETAYHQQLEQTKTQEQYQKQPQQKPSRTQPTPATVQLSPFKRCEFQVPVITIANPAIANPAIAKPGLLPKKLHPPTIIVNYHNGQADYLVESLGNGITLELALIPEGSFTMGSPNHELDRIVNETPQHRVKIQPFLMGKFTITQAQWQAVAMLEPVNRTLDLNPSHFKGSNRPVEQVCWYDAVEFCDRLSRQTTKHYRLPSEAEWEYACRAGTSTPFYCGDTIVPELANYDGNFVYGSIKTNAIYREETTEVGSFPPNAFGLYDMHGNVWEWCADQWHDNYDGAPVDGSAWTVGGSTDRTVMRGGSWNGIPLLCRSAHRDYYSPINQVYFLGFRVVCNLS